MKVTVIPILIDALRTIPKELVKKLEDMEIEVLVETIQTKTSLQNTEKSPGDLKRLAVTQTPMKDYQPMLV